MNAISLFLNDHSIYQNNYNGTKDGILSEFFKEVSSLPNFVWSTLNDKEDGHLLCHVIKLDIPYEVNNAICNSLSTAITTENSIGSIKCFVKASDIDSGFYNPIEDFISKRTGFPDYALALLNEFQELFNNLDNLSKQSYLYLSSQ